MMTEFEITLLILPLAAGLISGVIVVRHLIRAASNGTLGGKRI
ncbi:MAG: hypothetical protein QM773_13445 [Hyphomonadaceae bacterium]